MLVGTAKSAVSMLYCPQSTRPDCVSLRVPGPSGSRYCYPPGLRSPFQEEEKKAPKYRLLPCHAVLRLSPRLCNRVTECPDMQTVGTRCLGAYHGRTRPA